MTDFRYTETDWQAIKCAFAKIGVDADRTNSRRCDRRGASLRSLIEIAACMFIDQSDEQSWLNQRATERRARIENWKALRGQAEILRDAVDASSDSSGRYGMNMLEAVDTYIGWLSYQIDLFENPISIIESIIPGSNAALVNRQYFWRELIELWCEFGGKPTGDRAVAFLYAATMAVVAAMPDGKDKRAPTTPTIKQWLRRQAKKRRVEKKRQ